MSASLTEDALKQLFLDARTHNAWQDRPVSPEILKQVYDLAKMAPTSANCQPMRLVFVTSAEGKEKLRPALAPGNLEKTMSAPVTAIVGHDMAFYEHLPTLFPHADAKSWFVGNDALIAETAFRNGSLQGAYVMMAARALGLDCGAMSGFNQDVVNKTFFAGTSVRSNFLINLGYGDMSAVYPRSPRPDFETFCSIL